MLGRARGNSKKSPKGLRRYVLCPSLSIVGYLNFVVVGGGICSFEFPFIRQAYETFAWRLQLSTKHTLSCPIDLAPASNHRSGCSPS